jgi:hypothetical protein
VRQELLDSVRGIAQQEQEASMGSTPLFNSTHEGYAVILEEFEEATEDMGRVESFVEELWYSVRRNSFEEDGLEKNYAIENIRIFHDVAIGLACEAIQIAAMANKFIESINQRK